VIAEEIKFSRFAEAANRPLQVAGVRRPDSHEDSREIREMHSVERGIKQGGIQKRKKEKVRIVARNGTKNAWRGMGGSAGNGVG
jgi:hypothetical protein